tara:strand:+ start:284 stop:691 length:408 start_codon:yes stop_codon:yes gene_type:complete
MNDTYLGLDYGKRFIGVAVGSALTNKAEPLGVVTAHKGVPNWDQLDKFITTWQPQALIIGWPLNMDGTEQNLTQAVRVFENNLTIRYQLQCHHVDERLSTYEAKKILGKKQKDKKKVDATSAVVLLEQWLQESNI